MTEYRTTQSTTPSTASETTATGGSVAAAQVAASSSDGAGAGSSSSEAHSEAHSEARAIGRRQSDRIVAASESAQRSVDQATACARGSAAILIAGPNGSGRQHFGRAIHAWSNRAGQPFVIFSTTGTPEGLHERELFGTSDGSATPSENSDGALASAGRGTLLVAGIDRLEASVRAALIQAVQTGSFVRPGQSESVSVGARIIATADSAEDKLLGDIPTEVVSLDALSERREDVLPLAAHFLAEVADLEEIRPIGFTSDARHWLVQEEWSGNVRELRERIRQSVRLSRDGVISAESLLLATDGDEVPSFKDAKRAFETRYVEGLLRRCSGNISRAARLAKKDRKDFYDVIRRTGVDPSEFRT
ncbi:MAG: sigma-54-dependent Fis family transcriptional regulator [Deltaproteobacteria bacterium]|nr:sigma-54-dependent Fis family transcriptional regulator [Deltaproteobacteria bacterium]